MELPDWLDQLLWDRTEADRVLGPRPPAWRYATNTVGTETKAGIEPQLVDRLLGMANSPQAQERLNLALGFSPGTLGTVKPIRAYHGSPHMFDRFDLSKIGTGEGAQAYGHGLYFAGNEAVARGYRDALAPVRVVDQGGRPILDAWTPIAKAAQDAGAQFGAPPVQANKIADQVHRGLMDGDSLAHMRKFVAQSDWEPAERAMWEASLKTAEPWAAQRNGHMYEVNINAEPGQLLDWDKPLAGQSPQIQSALDRIGVPRDTPQPYTGLPLANGAKLRVETDPDFGPRYFMDMPSGGSFRINASDLSNLIGPAGGQLHGKAAWSNVAGRLGEQDASAAFRNAGIPGIQYLDAGSRGAGAGSRNYVIFDDKLIDILRRYGLVGTTGAGGLLGMGGGDDGTP